MALIEQCPNCGDWNSETQDYCNGCLAKEQAARRRLSQGLGPEVEAESEPDSATDTESFASFSTMSEPKARENGAEWHKAEEDNVEKAKAEGNETEEDNVKKAKAEEHETEEETGEETYAESQSEPEMFPFDHDEE